ncbi:DUF2190 family protein [bacterium]|nr:DUF2190 family protein [bacterium]
MSNYVLDRGFNVEEANGIAAHRVVVIGDVWGGCKYPVADNAGGVLGITTHAQTRQNKSVGVRMIGIAPCEASGAIPAGSPVAVFGSEGKIKKASGATMTLGSVGSDNAVQFAFRTPGMVGNSFQIRLVEGSVGSELAAAISGTSVDVTLASDGGGTILTTAAALIEFFNAHADLSRFIVASSVTGSAGTGLMAIDDEGVFADGQEGVNVLGTALQTAAADGDIVDVLLTL